MEKFTRLTATAAPIEAENVDTDQIVPARFLRTPRANGYGPFLFKDLRLAGGTRFVLDEPAYRGAQIIVANSNFACGSSREAAVYALVDSGFRCVIAPSFGDIFFNNCFKNGVLPVRLPAAQVAAIRAHVTDHPETQIMIDLSAQTVGMANVAPVQFDIDPLWKTCLLEGLDDISLTQRHGDRIDAFVENYVRDAPWTAAGSVANAEV